MKPVTVVIIGAGSRGTTYARYAAEYPEKAKVVGVAEPREFHRMQMMQQQGGPGGPAEPSENF